MIVNFAGLDIDYPSQGHNGGTSLHICCRYLTYGAAKVLLDNGASLISKNDSEHLPAGK